MRRLTSVCLGEISFFLLKKKRDIRQFKRDLQAFFANPIFLNYFATLKLTRRGESVSEAEIGTRADNVYSEPSILL